jgi:hypothetical protein
MLSLDELPEFNRRCKCTPMHIERSTVRISGQTPYSIEKGMKR